MVENQIVLVVKAIIRSSGKTLIIKRSDTDSIGAGTWETPGGKIEFGEDPESALIREVKEEVGLDITVESIGYVSSFLTSSTRQFIILAYHCRSETELIRLSNEHSDYLWANNEGAKQYLAPGILSDFQKHHILS